MNFDFGETEKALRQQIKGLFDTDSKAALAQLENGDTDQIRDALLFWLNTLGQAGYLSLGLVDGKNSPGLVAAQETLAAISPSLFLSVEVSTRVFGRLVAVYGTPDQKAEILSSLEEGRLIGTVGLSEAGMNIDNDPIDTTGVSSSNGFQISGSKGHVVNALVSDWIAIAGKVEENLAFFLMKNDSEGLSIEKKFSMLGYNGAAASTVLLEDSFVSSKYVIGPFQGREPLMTVRMWEDQVLTSASLGLMRRSFDAALNYAKNHTSGGKPIMAYQEVSFKLAEMLTLFQTAQLLAYRAGWMAETEGKEASILARCAKVFCSESAEKVASSALQILGKDGYLRGNPAEEGYRDAKYLQIAGTSSEISRMKIGDGTLG